MGFLSGKVAEIEAKSRADFKVSDAAAFDVVLLDWPQGEETREMRKLRSPLGSRDEWEKPTVLLGSAGLNLAVAWKMKGGSGCTCMDPLAYDLREHRIFETPFKIDRGKMISIPTPKDFQSEIKEKEIVVLPLVADHGRQWRAGWCTHARDFDVYPDVEFLCGGVNHQTPTSAGLWRQGNLLHFGFEQSPAEMNDLGRLLLLNAISLYQSFHGRPADRDHAVSLCRPGCARSIGSGALAAKPGIPHGVLPRACSLPRPGRSISQRPDRESMAQWADENAPFLHPDQDQLLTIDDDLVALGVKFDQPEFFDKVLAGLGFPRLDPDGPCAATARALRSRLVRAAAMRIAWASWWKENQRFAFASDAGDYRWYIDPLAKKRGCRRANCEDRSVPAYRSRMSRPADEEEGGGRKTRAGDADRSSEVARSAGRTFCLAVGGFAESKRCEDSFAINDFASPSVNRPSGNNWRCLSYPLDDLDLRFLGLAWQGSFPQFNSRSLTCHLRTRGSVADRRRIRTNRRRPR